MGNKLRFEDMRLAIFVGDREIGPLKITSSSGGSNMQVDNKKYMGDVRPTIDSTDQGFTMQFEVEVLPGTADPNEIFDEYRSAVNDREPTDVRITETWRVPGQSGRKGYRYSGCHVNISQNARTNSPTSWTLRLDAEAREAIG
jgi:hypothetical protein